MNKWMAVAAMAFSMVSFAQSAPDALVQPQDERTMLAKSLAKTMVTEEQHQKMLQSVSTAVSTQLQRNGNYKPDLDKRVFEMMLEILPYQEQLDLQTSLLVKYYSAEELKELTKFYSSPTGQKSIKIMPELMADVMGVTNEKIQRMMPSMIKKLTDAMATEKDDGAPTKAVSGAAMKKRK
ncbi:MAG: DUF2059 domain-containing protein [Myxococcaceae bacterium]